MINTSNLPSHSLAAILVKQQAPLVIDKICLPNTLKAGQVLVQVIVSGICGSQIGEINGVKGPDKYLPHLLGHEGGAKVLAIGPGVSHVAPGDHVVMHWMKGSGIDAEPAQYEWNNQILNAGQVTSFNKFAVVSENRLTTIPKDIPLDIAALFGCAVTTGLGIINHDAQVKFGEAVVVIGVGGVGLNVVQAAAMASAFPIIAVDLNLNALELAKEFGATHTIHSKSENLLDKMRHIIHQTSLTATSGADVIVECTGKVTMIECAYQLTNTTGRVVLVGVPQIGQNVSLYTLPIHFGKRLIGCHGGQCTPQEDIPRYIKLYQQGQLNLDNLIGRKCRLNEINELIFSMQQGNLFGRNLILMH